MKRRTPVGALIEGMVAGIVGAATQTLFFRLTRALAPEPPPEAFHPAEPEQVGESELETVARRLVECMAQRGPLSPPAKRRLGTLVHLGVGARFGAAYGLVRASYPRAWSLPGVAAFSLATWLVGDNLLVPLFRVAGWPHRYPLRSHAYAVAAHLAYGAGVAATLAAADRRRQLLAVGAFAGLRALAGGRRIARKAGVRLPDPLASGSRRLALALARRAVPAIA